MNITFGEKLKKARSFKKLKQSELAKQLGVTNTTISNWENNISKPDLDMLSYICGVLEVKASYFLDAKPLNEIVSSEEYDHIKKYRELDDHGKEMVDFVLEKEYVRSTSSVSSEKISEFPDTELAAAHERIDIEVTDQMRKHDDNIMMDDSEWE